jgi:5'-3' exoribonuclease 1
LDGLKDEYFSDLNVRDIGDDEVSDVNEEDINIDNVGIADTNPELRSKLKVQEDIIDKYSEANLQFMNEFIRLFSTSPEKAKAFYYNQKLKVDVGTEEGVAFKKRMLKKYLEGLQWVLYYYYRGAQHWRWFYPYHYAPMISDIDENIV